MNTTTATEKTTGMVLYAIAQSRDDRTMDIYSSKQDELVSDYTEQQRIMQVIEEKAPVSETKTIVLRTGKDWASGYLLPDSPGPRGRYRPVQFVAQSISWKTTDPPVFAESICQAMTCLIGTDELSPARLEQIRKRVVAIANCRKRFFGCLPAICCLAFVTIGFFLLTLH